MIKMYYKSAKGERFDLLGADIVVSEFKPRTWAWEYNSTALDFGIKINKFKKKEAEYTMTLAILGNKEKRDLTLESLVNATESDIVNNTPGRIITYNDWYINCFITEVDSTHPETKGGDTTEWTVLAPYPFWIHDETKSFRPQGTHEGDYLDYEYDYRYDYSFDSSGVSSWNINHYAQSDFVMTIYGYAENPRILINGREYIVYTTINENEYVVIDTRNKLVLKYLASGDILNIFDLRGKESDVFAKLDAGLNTITWSGTFGFDITAFIERSEPKW